MTDTPTPEPVDRDDLPDGHPPRADIYRLLERATSASDFWRKAFGVAVVLFVVTALLAFFSWRATEAERDRDRAITECRGQLAGRYQSAEGRRHNADDDVTIAIGLAAGVDLGEILEHLDYDPLPLDEALRQLVEAEITLEAATTARDEFDLNPTPDCEDLIARVDATRDL